MVIVLCCNLAMYLYRENMTWGGCSSASCIGSLSADTLSCTCCRRCHKQVLNWSGTGRPGDHRCTVQDLAGIQIRRDRSRCRRWRDPGLGPSLKWTYLEINIFRISSPGVDVTKKFEYSNWLKPVTWLATANQSASFRYKCSWANLKFVCDIASSGKSYICSTIVNFYSRVVIWGIFKSGMTLQS